MRLSFFFGEVHLNRFTLESFFFTKLGLINYLRLFNFKFIPDIFFENLLFDPVLDQNFRQNIWSLIFTIILIYHKFLKICERWALLNPSPFEFEARIKFL